MASIVRRPNGHKWIQFNRKTLRLGKCSFRTAEKHKQVIETVLACRSADQIVESEISSYLGKLPNELRKRYENCGLVGHRGTTSTKPATLADFIGTYFESRGQHNKSSTRTFWSHTGKRLVEYFGSSRTLASITPADARTFHIWLGKKSNKRDKPKDEKGNTIEAGLSPNTVRRRIGLCRQIFNQAVQDGLITLNPFAGMSATVRSNKERQYYVDFTTFNKVLDKAPNARWRALLVLARIGAVRVPSEICGLRWTDISWVSKRITIRSPKTEHIQGKESRLVPLYPAIESELLGLLAEAEDDAEFVFPDIRTDSNLRTMLEKLIVKAGVTQWPKLWHNLRASGATDLARRHPAHVAAAICGHSVEVAREHYWGVAEVDLDQALTTFDVITVEPKQNPKQKDAAPAGTTSHPVPDEAELVEKDGFSLEKEENEWARRDSNPRHLLCKSSALTN